MQISGTVVKGLGMAGNLNPDPALPFHGTIALQKPYFKNAGVKDIENIYEGTINVSIAPKEFKILKPDYKVTGEWTPNVTETFWLVSADVLCAGKKYFGYLYYPCPSEHKSHPDTVLEIIAEQIPTLAYGDSISIEVKDDKLSLTSL